ncbi:MAG: hypothetical protein HY654_05450 [Acidobacteria bacterium]|nr:hypothetical protein [Acidobacteriota bacterium]
MRDSTLAPYRGDTLIRIGASGVGSVTAVSGVIGFAIGLAFADWQVSVESAQALAGIVKYPPDNPFYIYHAKLWTIVNQLSAIALLAGMSEVTLCLLTSGLVAMMVFQGWALIVYALGGDALLAIGSTFLLFLSRVAQFGVIYPISIVDTSDTYGVVGLAALVLVVGFAASGWHRTAGFLFGAAPAIHPSLGVWLAVIVAVSVLWTAARIRPLSRAVADILPAWGWVAAGIAVTAISLLIQFPFMHDLPRAYPGFARKFFLAFVTHWDGHRQPVNLEAIDARIGVAFNAGAFGMAAIWLVFFAADLPRAGRLLLRLVAVTAVLSVAFGFMSWIAPERLPTWFLVLMPARLLNVNALMFPAFLFGLLALYRDRLWSWLILIPLSLQFLFSGRSLFWRWLERGDTDSPEVQMALFNSIQAAAVVLVLCVAAYVWLARRGPVSGFKATLLAPAASPGSARRALRAAALAVCALAGVVSLGLAERHARHVLETRFRDRTNDIVYAAAAGGQGLLLTAGDLHLIQLRTRRPVLLDGGGLDGVAYAPEAASAMDRIMREVYGVDIFEPPAEAYGGGRVPLGANRAAWERFSDEKWRTIARTYGVTQVLAFPDWKLPLPPVAYNRRLTLYDLRQ